MAPRCRARRQQARPDDSAQTRSCSARRALPSACCPGGGACITQPLCTQARTATCPRAGRSTTIPSGSLAAQWIFSYWRRLTSAQRQVVERRLAFSPTTSLAHAADYGDPGFKQDAAIQALADKYAGIYQTRLGHALGLKIV